MLINIYTEMKKKKVTQKDIAKLLGLSVNSVSKKINGLVAFSVDEILKIRNSLFPDCSIDYLAVRSN